MDYKLKYKIGDKVFVRKDLETKKYYAMSHNIHITDTVTLAMLSYAGKIVEIADISSNEKYIIKNCLSYWTDEMFAGHAFVKPIVIYREGDKVIAHDKNTGDKAEAMCAPGEDGDFLKSARLACDRLCDPIRQDFKPGDIIVGLPEASNVYMITKEGWIGVVQKVKTGNAERNIIVRGDKSTAYDVDCRYFRLATDDDITVETLRAVMW